MNILTRRETMAALLAIAAARPGFAAAAAGADDGIICAFGPLHGHGAMPKGQGETHLAEQTVGWIASVIGIEPNFHVRAAPFNDASTAYATIRKGRRAIVYDEAKFRWLEGSPNWVWTGIMAHEVGHHIGGHTAVRSDARWAQELEADRFAGFALGRLGADLEQATRWTKKLSPNRSKTHPPRSMRWRAATDGWRAGRA